MLKRRTQTLRLCMTAERAKMISHERYCFTVQPLGAIPLPTSSRAHKLRPQRSSCGLPVHQKRREVSSGVWLLSSVPGSCCSSTRLIQLFASVPFDSFMESVVAEFKHQRVAQQTASGHNIFELKFRAIPP